VYLASFEFAAVAAVKGRLSSVAEYMEIAKNLDLVTDDIYQYLNFNELTKYQKAADSVELTA
jgi:aconitate hydratase 2/2-methylisocitrate dehydratase